MKLRNALTISRGDARYASKIISATCLAGDTVGSPVYVSANPTGDIWAVSSADPANPAQMPAVGILISKPSPTATTCVVQLWGLVTGIYSGLTVGRAYYVVAGGVSLSAPVANVQILAVAQAENVIWLPGNLGGGGGGSGSALSIYDETTLLDNAVEAIKFIGTDVLAMDDGTGTHTINVYIPPVVFAPFYNQGAAAVGNVSTTSRHVAGPTAEGNPFKIGGWSAGSVHGCRESGTVAYSTGSECSFMDQTTTVEVNVYDADGVSVLASHVTAAITGNIDVTLNNIRVQVTNWATDATRYKADISVTATVSSMVSTGGRFSVEIIHHNSGTDYTKTQSDIFYDPDVNAPVLSGVSISETVGSVITRHCSGIEWYDIGSQFTVGIVDVDYLNDRSYPTTQVSVDGSEYGLPTLSLQGGDLTGWTSLFDDIDDSYGKTNWAITQVDLTLITTLANIRARWIDWSSGSWVNSSNAAILIETHDDLSTRLIERFYFENWRCPGTADFDNPDAKSWTSSADLGAGDACFVAGGCERNTTDWTIYNPNPGSQPDYSSSQNATVNLWRELMHDGTASSSGRLYISGSYTSLRMKLAGAWTGDSSGGTVWMDCLKDYNAGDFNFGDPQNNTGCRTGSGAGYIDVTFGTQNVLNTGDTIYIEVGFEGSERITTFSFSFD